jgi:hypothetical protein
VSERPLANARGSAKLRNFVKESEAPPRLRKTPFRLDRTVHLRAKIAVTENREENFENAAN